MASSKAKPIHVTFRKPTSDWAVKPEKADRALRVYDTKDQAVTKARLVAKENKTELVIHKKDGTIQDKDSFGRDPMPPKDAKH